MLLIDANAILRYILCDNEKMAVQVEDLLEKRMVNLRNEVLAEVVYVLNKVYSIKNYFLKSSKFRLYFHRRV